MLKIFNKQQKYLPGTIGFFGKLPQYGDFISLQVESDFVGIWDNWWQNILYERQSIEEDDKNFIDDLTWGNFFLNSPAWHFLFFSDNTPSKAWTGVFFPSQDSIGRLFPWTIVFNVTNLLPINRFLTPKAKKKQLVINWIEQSGINWHRYINSNIIAPLTNSWLIKDWLAQVKKPKIEQEIISDYHQTKTESDLDNKLPSSCFLSNKNYYCYLDKVKKYNNISRYANAWWWQEQSDSLKPDLTKNQSEKNQVFLISEELPHFLQMSAFFDKEWSKHGWKKL